ncbi:MAG TPA: DsbA family oxidoreductase [Actinomycetales bacterium]|nr:DsbA family oxidoreductase [Actinomycetales bacterium]
MKVEIWSDVVCPWCYIGKRRFEAALERFAHSDDVEVVWHSFELDPTTERTGTPGGSTERLAEKYGISLDEVRKMQQRVTDAAAGEGLDFQLDRAVPANTVDAHRVIHLAARHGLQGAMKERLLRAHFTEGESVGEADTLVRLAVEVGLDGDDVRSVLAGDELVDDVRRDEAEARALGITGVPFFVIDRTYGVSGAQPSELLLEALQTAWSESHPLAMVQAGTAGDADACGPDGCAI